MAELKALDCFPGGREGVRRRFAKAIGEALGGVSLHEARKFDALVGWEKGKLSKILESPDHYLNGELLEVLSDPFDIDIEGEGGFGEIDLSAEKQGMWSKLADEEGFYPVAGCDQEEWSARRRVCLFVLLKALEEL